MKIVNLSTYMNENYEEKSLLELNIKINNGDINNKFVL